VFFLSMRTKGILLYLGKREINDGASISCEWEKKETETVNCLGKVLSISLSKRVNIEILGKKGKMYPS